MRPNQYGFFFFSLAVAAGSLAMTGVSPDYVWVLPFLPFITAFFVMLSIVSFLTPVFPCLVYRLLRQLRSTRWIKYLAGGKRPTSRIGCLRVSIARSMLRWKVRRVSGPAVSPQDGPVSCDSSDSTRRFWQEVERVRAALSCQRASREGP
jgi:hypothetical protein